MAANGNGNGMGRNGLPTIQTRPNGICHDDSSAPVKANTIDELHSLQKKKSAPTTPLNGIDGTAFSFFTEEERQQQQLQSIRYTSCCSRIFLAPKKKKSTYLLSLYGT